MYTTPFLFQLTSIINYSITSLTTWPHNQAKKYNNVSSLSLFSRGKPLILQVNSLGKAKLQFAITLQFLPNRGEREKEHVLIYIIHRLNNKSFLNRREGFLVCYSYLILRSLRFFIFGIGKPLHIGIVAILS